MSRQPDVYFIQAVDGGPIKIGSTFNPVKRLGSLQGGSPVRLQILGLLKGAGRDAEGALHIRFLDSHSHGEWFHPTPELIAYIAEHARLAGPIKVRFKSDVNYELARRMRRVNERTQAEVAAEIGINERTLSYWERGKRLHRGELLGTWAKAVGLTVEELLSDEMPSSPPRRVAS